MRDADTRRPEVKNLTTMLGSMLSGIFTSATNNTMARQNAREAMDWQERMMDKQNQYNSPLNQLLMKKAAGVTPYANTDFVPSAGVSNVKADTIPMNDPLMYAKTFAEIENINAATNKTESESEKLLKEMSMLDLAYSRGLLEKEEYEKRLEMMFEAWEKANPYEVEIENTQSGTALNEAQTETEGAKQSNLEASTNLLNAQEITETSLRQLKARLLSDEHALLQANTSKAYAEVNNIKLNSAKLAFDVKVQDLKYAISNFYGVDITSLSGSLQEYGASLMSRCMNGNLQNDEAIAIFYDAISRQVDKDSHIPRTYSSSDSRKIDGKILALFGLGEAASHSESMTY